MDAIYKIIPRAPEPLDSNLTGRDEVPKAGARNLGKLGTWVATPMGVAYRNWARTVPHWDVDDMADELVYATGTGTGQIWWVPARNNGTRGPAGRYYWVPVSIVEDLDAEAQAQAEEISAANARAKLIADAQNGGSSGTMSSNPYVVSGSVAAPGKPLSPQPAKELSLFEGPNGRIWYAMTVAQSSSASQSPHPGIALAGPMAWNQKDWGKPEDQGLPPGIRLVTMDDTSDVSTVRPAAQEYQIVLARAQQGDESAAMVLQSLGIPFQPESAGGLLGSLFGF